MDKLTQRLNPERPIATVSLQMPLDVIEDLERIASLLGFSGHQALMRAYVGQGLRHDLERFDQDSSLAKLVDSLRRRGVDSETIAAAVADAQAAD